jgi:hypothetical protein
VSSTDVLAISKLASDAQVYAIKAQKDTRGRAGPTRDFWNEITTLLISGETIPQGELERGCNGWCTRLNPTRPAFHPSATLPTSRARKKRELPRQMVGLTTIHTIRLPADREPIILPRYRRTLCIEWFSRQW